MSRGVGEEAQEGAEVECFGWFTDDLVSTTYSAQGKTADRVMALMDATTSQESFYVAVSRAKYQLSLYTADPDDLLRQAQRSSAKENVSDYIPLFNLVNTHAQTSESNPRRRPLNSGPSRCRQGSWPMRW